MKLKNLLIDAYLEGSRAPLYHFTSFVGAALVADWDRFKPGKKNKKKYISFTRDKNYARQRVPTAQPAEVRFDINAELLKRDYKVVPYRNLKHYLGKRPKGRGRWEAEERIEVGPRGIVNFSKYVNQVVISKFKLEYLEMDFRNGTFDVDISEDKPLDPADVYWELRIGNVEEYIEHLKKRYPVKFTNRFH